MNTYDLPVTGTGNCPFCGHGLRIETTKAYQQDVSRISGGKRITIETKGYSEVLVEWVARIYCPGCGSKFRVPDGATIERKST